MSEDRSRLNVLGHFSGGLTASQGAWPVVTLECNAQMQTRRHARKVLGRVPALCWTDHANVARLQTAIDMDPRHLRWVADIQSNGSTLKNLSGRSARLGDGLSRNPLTDEIRRRGQSINGVLVGGFPG